MAPQRKSTTPTADEKHAKYAAMYARDEHVTCTLDMVRSARCPKCGKRYAYVMSEYAMWYGSNDHCMICACNRIVWFHVETQK